MCLKFLGRETNSFFLSVNRGLSTEEVACAVRLMNTSNTFYSCSSRVYLLVNVINKVKLLSKKIVFFAILYTTQVFTIVPEGGTFYFGLVRISEKSEC